MNIDVLKNLAKALESKIARYVALILTPILLPLIGAAAIWLEKNIGVHVDPVVATGYVVTVVGGVALAIYKWLEGRAHFEQQALNATLYSQAALVGQQPPSKQTEPLA